MPMRDWTRVDAGVFHDFHQRWIIAISNALNDGLLPNDFYAMAEQVAEGPIPDVVTLEHVSASNEAFADLSDARSLRQQTVRSNLQRGLARRATPLAASG